MLFVAYVRPAHPLSDTPQLREALMILLPMAWQWRNIAALLRLPAGQIEVIRVDNSTVNDCLQGMLSEWLNQVDPRPSWNDLAEAVETLHHPAIAEEIREQFVGRDR